VKTDGDVLGMFKDAHFGLQTVEVTQGDKFFVYSDGLVESAEEQITWASGADSLLPIFDNIMDVSYEKAPVALMDCLFKDNALPEDDIVVLCVEV